MSFASGFSGFAAGLGGAVQETRARKDRNAAMAQNNQMLEMMAAQGGMGLGGAGQGGAALGGAGLGAASTGGATPAAPAKPQGRITQMLSKVRETGEELGGALGLRETDGEPTTGLGRALARVRDTGHAWGEALGLREPDAPPLQFTPGSNSFLPQGGGGGQPSLSYGAASPGAPSTGSVGSFYDLLAKHEGAGNPDTLYAHAQRPGGRFEGVRPSTMTLAQLDDFDKEYGQWVAGRNNGVVATPVGASQIVGTTRRSAMKAMGLTPDTVFSPEVQRAMTDHLATQRLSRGKTMADKLHQIRQEWVGLRNVPDDELIPVIREMEARGMGRGLPRRKT